MEPGYILWRNAEGRKILDLLRKFRFGDHADLAPISENSLFQDYLQDRVSDELSAWDIAIPMRKTGASSSIAGLDVRKRERDKGTVRTGVYRVYGSRSRVADPGDAWIDLDAGQTEEAEKAIADEIYKTERAACSVRKRPLMLIHVFDANLSDKEGLSDSPLVIENPVMTLSFCMPETRKPAKERTYQVNAVYRQQLEMLEEAGRRRRSHQRRRRCSLNGKTSPRQPSRGRAMSGLPTSDHPLDFRIGRDFHGRFVFQLDAAGLPDLSAAVPRLAGIDCEVVEVPPDGCRMSLTLNHKQDLPNFRLMCTGLMLATDDVLPGQSHTGMLRSIEELHRWQEMLRHQRERLLSRNEIIGLVGELSFVRDVLCPRLGILPSLRAWNGPEGHEQDFRARRNDLRGQDAGRDGRSADPHFVGGSAGSRPGAHNHLQPGLGADSTGRRRRAISQYVGG